MGGYGSGRWGTHLKNYTVEDCLVLNIDKLIRDRLIYAGAHSCGNLIWTLGSTGKQLSMCGYEFDTLDLTNAWLRLIYTLSGTKDQLNYRVNLTTTQPRYGGVRWWMVCPLMKNRSQYELPGKP